MERDGAVDGTSWSVQKLRKGERRWKEKIEKKREKVYLFLLFCTLYQEYNI